MTPKRKRGRWIALGLTVGLVVAWGGFATAESAPSSITTCTKASNGKTKLIAPSQTAKCNAKGKGIATTWDPHSITVALQNQLTAANSELGIKRPHFEILKGSIA